MKKEFRKNDHAASSVSKHLQKEFFSRNKTCTNRLVALVVKLVDKLIHTFHFWTLENRGPTLPLLGRKADFAFLHIFVLGHFTQEIWIESTELGIGVASYEDNGWNWEIVVANYYPPGNIMGQFKENVLTKMFW